MIPVKLELQGLYSYKEKQLVDFEQLTAAGLFGIFGDVGSGKSSILEAILLALYGSTERLSDRGEKNSMVNLQSDQVLINFEFKSGKNNSRTYLGRYCAKRNTKNFDEVRPAEHTFYEKLDGQFHPLTQRAEEIVGMKKDHFKQTVIIPQGKFREFIDLTPGPRADMMKELFGLERFDLFTKTGILLKSLRENKIRVETQLQTLESYTEEVLAEKEFRIKDIAIRTEQEEQSCIKAELEFQKQEVLKTKHHQLQGFLSERQELEKNLPAIEEKKRLWKDFLKAKTHLKPVWSQLNDQLKELEKYRISVVDCRRFKDTFVQEIAKLEQEENDLKEKANKKSEREGKIRDLKKVLELQRLTAVIKASRQKFQNLQPQVEAQLLSQKEKETKIKQLEEISEKIQIPDTSQIAEWKSASKDLETWQNQFKKSKTELLQTEQSLKSLEKELFQLKTQIPPQEHSFDHWIANLKQKIKRLEQEKDKLLQKKGLAVHVSMLQDGQACPLCGSLDHPTPLEAELEELELQEKNIEIEKFKTLLDQVFVWAQKYSEQTIRQENMQSNFTLKKSEADQLEKQLNSQIEQLKTQGIYSRQELLLSIKSREDEVLNQDNLRKEIKALRKKWEADRMNLEEKQQELKTIEQQILSHNAFISSKKDEIVDRYFTKPFFDREPLEIEQTIQNVQKDIEQIAYLLTGKQKVLQETLAKQATNLANLNHYAEMFAKTETKIAELEGEFARLREVHGFSDKKALIDLFEHSLDADKVDAEIRQYENRRNLVQCRVEELQNEDGVTGFKADLFAQLQIALQEKKESLAKIKKEFTLLDQDIKESCSRLKEKKLLEKEFSKLENRETNLKELEKLFKGSGFVKYVSSIYLKELCNTANLRYMKLTKNSLSLEIDENNTFWVIDYLNGGKKRLLKTLSGGQTFQASLCLALALAEKVKSLNQADQSFFFLDEGFGALDRNSLRVVFETLKALRHENRIVGIISHVEELQQEIEVYAKVELDSEKGSQVGYSF